MISGDGKLRPAGGPAGRRLGLAAATALVMGNMIGSGVFLLPASLAPFGWNAVLGWLVTIAGTLVLAWLLAMLTKARPQSRDPMGFVEDGFGEVASFLVGWIYWVSVWTAVAAIAIAAIGAVSLTATCLRLAQLSSGAAGFRP